MATQCFCGCRTTIPRFPFGMRSMNIRGRLMMERIAWFKDLFGEPTEENLDEWLTDGTGLLVELQAAMHGELHPRELESGPSAQWLKYGRGIDRVAQSRGLPTLNRWLEQNSDRILNLVTAEAQCPVCGKWFGTANGRDQHLAARHPEGQRSQVEDT